MKFLVITFSSLLLLTGCSSSTVSQEQAVKLVEYERCLAWQQGLTTQINDSLTELFAKNPTVVIEILTKQGEFDTKTGLGVRFKKHLENCLPLRP